MYFFDRLFKVIFYIFIIIIIIAFYNNGFKANNNIQKLKLYYI